VSLANKKYLYYRTPFFPLRYFFISRNYLQNNKKIFINYWRREYEKTWLLSRSTWSLVILVLLRRTKSGKRRIKILVPSYYCGSTIAIIRKLNVEITYYEIDEFLAPKKKVLIELLKSYAPDIVVLVHHLGNAQRLLDLEFVFSKYDTWIVEDATQCFLPTDEMGKFSHFILFSPYKFLPITYGAILIMTKKGNETGLNDQLFTYFIERIIREYSDSIQSSFTQLLNQSKWLVKHLFRFLISSSKSNSTFTSIAAEFTKIESPKVSWFNRKLFQIIMNDIENIKKQRITNLCVLQKLLNVKKYQSFLSIEFMQFILGEVQTKQLLPITFPIVFNSEEDAERVFSNLIQEEVQVNTWPDLPKEVMDNSKYFKTANKMRMQIVHFPIHQSITLKKEEIDLLLTKTLFTN
jgi:hypothetical protein